MPPPATASIPGRRQAPPLRVARRQVRLRESGKRLRHRHRLRPRNPKRQAWRPPTVRGKLSEGKRPASGPARRTTSRPRNLSSNRQRSGTDPPQGLDVSRATRAPQRNLVLRAREPAGSLFPFLEIQLPARRRRGFRSRHRPKKSPSPTRRFLRAIRLNARFNGLWSPRRELLQWSSTCRASRPSPPFTEKSRVPPLLPAPRFQPSFRARLPIPSLRLKRLSPFPLPLGRRQPVPL